VVFVRGLAQALETTTDYLLGLSDEPQPGAMAFFRRYGLADEEQLLALLAERNAEMAKIMRAVRDIPDEEQEGILQHLKNDLLLIGTWRPSARRHKPAVAPTAQTRRPTAHYTYLGTPTMTTETPDTPGSRLRKAASAWDCSRSSWAGSWACPAPTSPASNAIW
jgi:hypothetical protein